jgi:hypothetical protein
MPVFIRRGEGLVVVTAIVVGESELCGSAAPSLGRKPFIQKTLLPNEFHSVGNRSEVIAALKCPSRRSLTGSC